MKRIKKINLLYAIILFISVSGCKTAHRANGWYPVSDYPDYLIEGKAIVTTKDFAECAIDSVSYPGMIVIEGELKSDKILIWADATENRMGKCIGYVFNDSVVMAPTIHSRIESGRFTITGEDRTLIYEIYNSLK